MNSYARAGLVLLAAVAVIVPAVVVPAAHAASTPAHAASTPASSPPLPSDVKRACAWPPPGGRDACLDLIRTDITNDARAADTVPYGYGPADLQSAYALPSGGSGQTVAIVDAYDDPNAEQDLAAYRAKYGLPACTTANGCFSKVNEYGVHGNYPFGDPGWATEISLDLDMVSAVCPKCHILLVEAATAFPSDLGLSVNLAVSLGAKFVSNSYGSPEVPGDAAYDPYYTHAGVAITVATGDSGYGVSYPASSPGVTAVGGTSLLPASTARGWAEIAWSYGGSGCSGFESKPSWQKDTGCGKRTVADVSAVADPSQGLAVYDSYDYDGWIVVGGTSAATPIIAAVYALAGTPAKGTNPAAYPYQNSGKLFDIEAGVNTFSGCSPTYLCTAGPGYDGPTGLGTPDGAAAFR